MNSIVPTVYIESDLKGIFTVLMMWESTFKAILDSLKTEISFQRRICQMRENGFIFNRKIYKNAYSLV